VAPRYCVVAPSRGSGAATEPEEPSSACVRPRGPEGVLGCRVKPEQSGSSRSDKGDMGAGRPALGTGAGARRLSPRGGRSSSLAPHSVFSRGRGSKVSDFQIRNLEPNMQRSARREIGKMSG
jgi:hypothetical protein